jgi:E3 ubiquitin-protein ligase HUWE1
MKSTFKWAISQDGKVPLSEGLEHPDLPEGAGEFLDSWLMLLEKMVNPRMVLESPHTMPNKSQQADFVPFDPVQYLIRTHRVSSHCLIISILNHLNVCIFAISESFRMHYAFMG